MWPFVNAFSHTIGGPAGSQQLVLPQVWPQPGGLGSSIQVQGQRACTSLLEGPNPLHSRQAHRGSSAAGFHNQLNGAEIRLLKYPTGSFECFQTLLMPSTTQLLCVLKTFHIEEFTEAFVDTEGKNHLTLFVAGHSWAVARCLHFAKITSLGRARTPHAPLPLGLWLGRTTLFSQTHDRENIAKHKYHTHHSVIHISTKPLRSTQVSIRIMPIKALFKILNVRTSISHIYLISHFIFPATMQDGWYYYYYYYYLKKLKGREVRLLAEVSDLVTNRGGVRSEHTLWPPVFLLYCIAALEKAL